MIASKNAYNLAPPPPPCTVPAPPPKVNGQALRTNCVQIEQNTLLKTVSPARTAHDLHNECPLVGRRCAHDRVDRFQDSLKRRVRTDRHVGPAEVVVDRPDDADQV